VRAKFIGGMSCEKALGVAYTGMDTKISGDLLTLTMNDVKVPAGFGVGAAISNPVSQLHVLLVAELIIEIRGGQVTVLT
jgi:hypothetical protein